MFSSLNKFCMDKNKTHATYLFLTFTSMLDFDDK